MFSVELVLFECLRDSVEDLGWKLLGGPLKMVANINTCCNNICIIFAADKIDIIEGLTEFVFFQIYLSDPLISRAVSACDKEPSRSINKIAWLQRADATCSMSKINLR